MEIGWTDVGSREYILVSCAHGNTSLIKQLLIVCLPTTCRLQLIILLVGTYKIKITWKKKLQ